MNDPKPDSTSNFLFPYPSSLGVALWSLFHSVHPCCVTEAEGTGKSWNTGQFSSLSLQLNPPRPDGDRHPFSPCQAFSSFQRKVTN